MKITVHNKVEEACTFGDMYLFMQYSRMDSGGVVDKKAVYVKYSSNVLLVYRTTDLTPEVFSAADTDPNVAERRFVPLRNPVTIQFTMPAW
jgi:hypothetical protein